MSSLRTRDPRLVAMVSDRYVGMSQLGGEEEVESKGGESSVESKRADKAWMPSTRFNAQNISSASPVLPEPMARLSPTGTGISVRKLPAPSFTALRKACQFYEVKCSGKYSAKSAAARYLFQLSREVQEQIVALEKSDAAKMRRIGFLENLIKEWEDVFGSPTDEELKAFRRNGLNASLVSPQNLANLIKEQQRRIDELEGMVENAKVRQKQDLERFEVTVNDHYKISRQQYLLETTRIKKKYAEEAAELRSTLSREISEAKKERKEMRENLQREKEKQIADAVADIDRRVEEATKRGVEQAKEDKDLGLEQIHKIRNDLQLERIRMSSEIKRKERLVEEALQRLSRQHEVEIARLKTVHSAMLKKAIERGKTKEKSTITKAQNLRLENDWLRRRVSELQEIVESLQIAMIADQ